MNRILDRDFRIPKNEPYTRKRKSGKKLHQKLLELADDLDVEAEQSADGDAGQDGEDIGLDPSNTERVWEF